MEPAPTLAEKNSGQPTSANEASLARRNVVQALNIPDQQGLSCRPYRPFMGRSLEEIKKTSSLRTLITAAAIAMPAVPTMGQAGAQSAANVQTSAISGGTSTRLLTKETNGFILYDNISYGLRNILLDSTHDKDLDLEEYSSGNHCVNEITRNQLNRTKTGTSADASKKETAGKGGSKDKTKNRECQPKEAGLLRRVRKTKKRLRLRRIKSSGQPTSAGEANLARRNVVQALS